MSVYYCRDFVVGDKYWLKHGRRVEDELARASDMVLTNSTFFAKRFGRLNRNTFPIETGVDLSVYDASKVYPEPEDMKMIPRPIIGYMGTVNSTRLDIPLLEELAGRCRQWSFVFVGPEDDVFMEWKMCTSWAVKRHMKYRHTSAHLMCASILSL